MKKITGWEELENCKRDLKHMDGKSIIGGQYGQKGKEIWYTNNIKSLKNIIIKREKFKTNVL